GYPPLHQHKWAHLPNAASRYITMMQSRRSLLIWKIYGERLDGWQNDEMPFETILGDPNSLHHKGQPVPNTNRNREIAHIGYTGSRMPPPEAVKAGKVKPLSDEDRLTLVRWVDLGCPVDLTFGPQTQASRGNGWTFDDVRPTLTLAEPRTGANPALARILVGMHDYATGLDATSFAVVADFSINGAKPGENLAKRFQALPDGRWELKLDKPITELPRGKLTVSVKDKQGNTTRIERSFSVSAR